jgi:BirA family biotin operon repressor/biotin-[acetyl-CoA-carboxylase] ligase
MLVLTDSVNFGKRYTGSMKWTPASFPKGSSTETLSSRLLGDSTWCAELPDSGWKSLLLAERASRSQFDTLAELGREAAQLPDRLLCAAGSGDNFHGFKNRSWSALPGNIHLSAHFRPRQQISGFGVPFLLLGVVSVIQTIDSIAELNGAAQVKWVNDILIAGAKVAGILVRVQTQGNRVSSALVGIGLNVETQPAVESNPFVPQTAFLRSFQPAVREAEVFKSLSERLIRNYDLLPSKQEELLDIYRSRSIVMNRKVRILEDRPDGELAEITRGIVEGIGDQLELHLRGIDHPVTNGRVVLD